jgi:protein gp37
VWRFGCNPNEKLKNRYNELVSRTNVDGFICEYDWTGRTTVDFEPLERLVKVRKLQVVAFSWRGDWMYKPEKDDIDYALDIMESSPQHVFLTLTKRPEKIEPVFYDIDVEHGCRELGGGDYCPNIWLGVSAWDQVSYENACRYLAPLKKGGWHTWISLEPLLAPVNISAVDFKPDWIVVGAETGKGARHIDSIEILQVWNDCRKLKIPCFVKKIGNTNIAIREGYRQFPREIAEIAERGLKHGT